MHQNRSQLTVRSEDAMDENEMLLKLKRSVCSIYG